MLLTYKKPFESKSTTFQIKKRQNPCSYWFIFLKLRIPSSLFYNFYLLNMKNFTQIWIGRVFTHQFYFCLALLRKRDKLLRINLIIIQVSMRKFLRCWLDWWNGKFHFDETPKPATCLLSHDITTVAEQVLWILRMRILMFENHLGVSINNSYWGESSAAVIWYFIQMQVFSKLT
jgi:hypothetical protein